MMNRKLTICMLAAIVLTACRPQTPRLGKDTTDDVIAAMTLDEKLDVLVGGMSKIRTDTVVIVRIKEAVPGAAGTTNAVERLGIPQIVLADGPAGLRINALREGDSATYYCTHFPIGMLLASTWNEELVEHVGKAIGNEVKEYGVDILLAPGLNIQRHPLCGRNFEYYSEDPLVSGKIAAAYVRGVQGNGVGTAPKHFAANNQETNRMLNDSYVSQRALREIYLKGFEIMVKESDPWMIMTAYNALNGTFTSESPELIDSLLRKEWGYKGTVVTDWFAGKNPVAQMKAGNDMLQGGLDKQVAALKAAVADSTLDESVLDKNVERVLDLIQRTPSFQQYAFSNHPDLKAHAEITRNSALEGMILLENRNNTLPLAKEVKNIALFGCTSYDFIAGGTGSGSVNGAYTVSLQEGLRNAGYVLAKEPEALYMPHVKAEKARIAALKRQFWETEIRPTEIIPDASLIRRSACENDLAIITIGRSSGECYDRPSADFALSSEELKLMHAVCKAFHAENKRVVVILNIGGPIETASWRHLPDAVLCAWQAGQEGGNSVTDLLSGKVSPSGKLTITFPLRYQDAPSTPNFPVDVTASVEVVNKADRKTEVPNLDYTVYEEGIYVGYRYYDSFHRPVAYPFGYGLSYTTFEYDNAAIHSENDTYKVVVDVTNTGQVSGKEIVQLYVSAPESSILDKPDKELKAFAKTRLLAPGETQTITLTVPAAELASYSERQCAWVVDAGMYRFLLGASSQDIRAELHAEVQPSVHKTMDILRPISPIEELHRGTKY